MNVHDFIDYRLEKTARAGKVEAFARGFGRGAVKGGKKGAIIGGATGGSIGAAGGGTLGHLLANSNFSQAQGGAGAIAQGALEGGIAGTGAGAIAGGLTGGVIGGITQGIKEMRKAGQKPTVSKVKSIAERITGRPVSKKQLQIAGLVTASGGLTMAGAYGYNKRKSG